MLYFCVRMEAVERKETDVSSLDHISSTFINYHIVLSSPQITMFDDNHLSFEFSDIFRTEILTAM